VRGLFGTNVSRSTARRLRPGRLPALMETADDVTGPINIGNPAEFSIRVLAEIVIDVTGSRSKIVSRPLPADDPRQRQPDIAKARHVLGWTPRTPLKEGLVQTIAYFENLLQEDGVRAVVGGEHPYNTTGHNP
jgi:UDP-glucuronate decarboxylase